MTAKPNPEARDRAARSDKKIAFAALHHKDFRVYFVATMLAMMADNIEHVISYWLLYEKFRSPVLAGFAVLSHWTPFLLFSVYFGAMADRYDCRKVIQVAQIMFMGVSAACFGTVEPRKGWTLAKGIVSRKKQIVPHILRALAERRL